MPMITVRILAGHSRETKDKLAKGFAQNVLETIPELTENDVWVVFEDVPAEDWYVGGKNS